MSAQLECRFDTPGSRITRNTGSCTSSGPSMPNSTGFPVLPYQNARHAIHSCYVPLIARSLAAAGTFCSDFGQLCRHLTRASPVMTPKVLKLGRFHGLAPGERDRRPDEICASASMQAVLTELLSGPILRDFRRAAVGSTVAALHSEAAAIINPHQATPGSINDEQPGPEQSIWQAGRRVGRFRRVAGPGGQAGRGEPRALIRLGVDALVIDRRHTGILPRRLTACAPSPASGPGVPAERVPRSRSCPPHPTPGLGLGQTLSRAAFS